MRRSDAIVTFLAMLLLWGIVGTIEKCDAERAAKAARLAPEPLRIGEQADVLAW